MKSLSEVQVKLEGITFPMTSLSKLVGSNVKDVLGYVTNEFGDSVFKISRILFEDGRITFVNGEHDIAYMEDYNEPPLVSQEQLESLEKEEQAQ